MARTKSLAAVVAIGAALALPTVAGAKPAKADEARRGLDSINQPVVQRTDYLLDLADNGGLSDADMGRLDSWFESLALGYGDHVFADRGSDAARRDVARVAAAYGLLMSQSAPVLEGDIPGGAIRVVVSRTTASVPNCPNFDKERGPSTTSSNYGCAVNSNLAAMIADPNHLVLGQVGSVTGDASTSTKAIRVWRQTEPTGARGLTSFTTSGRTN